MDEIDGPIRQRLGEAALKRAEDRRDRRPQASG